MFKFINEIKVKSIPEQIAEGFKKEIINGKLQPGNKLPSLEELTYQLGVSKPTIREAFQLLQEIGLIFSTKGRSGGYFVADYHPDKLTNSIYEMISVSLSLNKLNRSQLLELRKMVEIPCAGYAAERRTSENLESLERIYDQITNTLDEDREKLLELDLEFHLVIAESTQNPLATTFVNAMARSFLEADLTSHKNKQMIIGNLDKVLEAIAKQDCEATKSSMEKHLASFL